MPLPKRRHSPTRSAKRRTHQKLTVPTLTECGNCHAMILTHNTCFKCGYYMGRKVDHTIKDETKKKREG
jgi:large subunit ribosomal protein L32